jgi:prepilin-type N-terminal cleavage/methylation domain-containing protein
MATGRYRPLACLATPVAGPKPVALACRCRPKSAAAFTLVEIMVVVVLIGLLAALAMPAFSRMRQRSQASLLANDFRQYEAAFQRFALENGSWPVATAMGLVPTGMSGFLPNGYTQPSPLGGGYLWSGPSRNVVLRGTLASDAVMQMVDTVLDDGTLTTGNFTKIAPNTFGYRAD